MGIHCIKVTAILFVTQIENSIIQRLYINKFKPFRNFRIFRKEHSNPSFWRTVYDMHCTDICICIKRKALIFL